MGSINPSQPSPHHSNSALGMHDVHSKNTNAWVPNGSHNMLGGQGMMNANNSVHNINMSSHQSNNVDMVDQYNQLGNMIQINSLAQMNSLNNINGLSQSHGISGMG